MRDIWRWRNKVKCTDLKIFYVLWLAQQTVVISDTGQGWDDTVWTTQGNEEEPWIDPNQENEVGEEGWIEPNTEDNPQG